MLIYFLVESESTNNPLRICERNWTIRKQEYCDSGDDEDSTFTCISYTWGPVKVSSPFHNSYQISDRTVPALTAAIKARPDCKRFWIDAFCVPLEPAERTTTLASMGFIYSRATEVIIVLSPNAQLALSQMRVTDRIDISALQALEKDEWALRAWTYQEVVNSRNMFFTCFSSTDENASSDDGSAGSLIPGADFLNCLGYSLTRLPWTPLERIERFPRLEAFENVILDWMTADYLNRSALQIMVIMARRTQQRDEDHFYAMIGALTTELPSLSASGNPCEEFMVDCEKKGDYSFIFSTAEREAKGRRWRPVNTGRLPPIFPWPLWGEKQPGHWEDGKFHLDQVILPQSGRPTDEIVRGVRNKMCETFGDESVSVEELIFQWLTRRGFKGSSSCVSLVNGFFFPYKPIARLETTTIMVSATLSWPFGAPGLVWEMHDQHAVYSAGIFIGVVDSKMSSSVTLD